MLSSQGIRVRPLGRIRARTLGIIILVGIAFVLVDALWLRLQVFVLGAAPLPNAAVKLLIAVAGAAAVVLFRGHAPRHAIFPASLAAVCVLALNAAHLKLARGMPLSDILIAHNAYYWSLLLLPLILAVGRVVPARTFQRFVLLIGIPLVVLGVLQFVFQRPIVPLGLPAADFHVHSWRFHGTGHLRAFSLFGSGQTFGYLLAPLASLALVNVVRATGRARFWYTLLVFMVLAATVFTLTRATFLVVGLALLATIAYLTRLRHYLSILPYIYLIAAGVILAGLAGIRLPLGIDGLFDTTSLFMRVNEWAELYREHRSADALAQLMGLGYVQNEQVRPQFRAFTDNSYFAVVLHHGWLGLIGWIALMSVMWSYAHRRARESRSPLAIALAASFTAWPIAGLFNVVIAVFGVYILLLALLEDTPGVPGPERFRPLARPAEDQALAH